MATSYVCRPSKDSKLPDLFLTLQNIKRIERIPATQGIEEPTELVPTKPRQQCTEGFQFSTDYAECIPICESDQVYERILRKCIPKLQRQLVQSIVQSKSLTPRQQTQLTTVVQDVVSKTKMPSPPKKPVSLQTDLRQQILADIVKAKPLRKVEQDQLARDTRSELTRQIAAARLQSRKKCLPGEIYVLERDECIRCANDEEFSTKLRRCVKKQKGPVTMENVLSELKQKLRR